MNIHSVDNQTFSSNRERNLSYNSRKDPRYNVDNIIKLDDASIRRIAYARTVNEVEDNKNKKINKFILASVPVAAGISSALLMPAKSSVLGKNIKGTAARLLNGAKSTVFWGMLFGLAGAISAGRNYLEDKFPKVDKFTRENPLLTFFGSVGAFAATLALGLKSVPKMISGASKYIDAKAVEKLRDSLTKTADKFNDNRLVSAVTDTAVDLKNSSYFSPFKNIVKTAVSWAPMTLLWGGILHSFNHRLAKREEFEKNYSGLKDYQHRLANARINELKAKNRILEQAVKLNADANV